MRIVIFNVKYSPNLGDGLLSECLEAELRAQGSDIFVTSVDLATRAGYGQGGRYRGTSMAILESLPGFLRRIVAKVALKRLVSRRLAPLCQATLTDADAAVLGGGNLLADADLNFPIKIACALGEAAAAGTPVGVFGVGVSDNWSTEGAKLFGDALASVRLAHAAVRDERSQAIWNRKLGARGVASAILCRDPGLLTTRHFPAAPQRKELVGLCLTNPLALRYHGATTSDHALDDWLVALVEALVRSGKPIALFTNGSPEDREYLDRIAPRMTALGDPVSIAPGFETPRDLARFVSGCGLIVAHRMHACIAAYSYAIPHLGLSWDPKLDSFFESVGRSDFMVEPSQTSAIAAATLADRAIAEGINAGRHAAIVAEATQDVRALHESLAAAVAA